MTNLTYSFNTAGRLTSLPEELGGHLGEHNATALTLKPAADFCPNAHHYRLLFDDYISEELYPAEDGSVCYTLPQSLTRSGTLTFQLAGYALEGGEVTLIAKTEIVCTKLSGSLKGSEEVDDEALDQLEALIASSRKAAEEAAGCKIANGSVTSDGELVLTYADGSEVNVGNVKGPKGDEGSLAVATSSKVGAVKPGRGLELDPDGTLHTKGLSITTDYVVDTPPWEIQPQLVAGDKSALKTWEENFYYAYFGENPGEFMLLETEGDPDSAVKDADGTTLLFRFAAGDYMINAGHTLVNGRPVDLISNSSYPVLRYAGVTAVSHYSKIREIFGVGPDITEVSVSAGVLNARFNSINFNAASGNLADSNEYQCAPDGSGGVFTAKKDNLRRASLLLYNMSGFTKKFCNVRLHATLNTLGGNIWNATIDGTMRQGDDIDITMDSTTAKANTFHRTVKQTGHLMPPTRNISEDICEISYSSVRGALDIRNGSVITIKEMKI